DLDDLARHFYRAGQANEDAPAGARVDCGACPPPGGPARIVGEIAEDEVARGFDEDRAVERVRKIHYVPFRFMTRFRERRRGRGPRLACSSSAWSFSRQSASFHMRSSVAATGPSAARRAR